MNGHFYMHCRLTGGWLRIIDTQSLQFVQIPINPTEVTKHPLNLNLCLRVNGLGKVKNFGENMPLLATTQDKRLFFKTFLDRVHKRAKVANVLVGLAPLQVLQ